MVIHEMLLQKKKYMAIETNKRIGPGVPSYVRTIALLSGGLENHRMLEL